MLGGRYRVERPIARGGMSTVYRCADERLSRAVAVKVMDERLVDDPVFRRRFEREAKSMARLSHPNLVGVYDFDSEADHLYLVMELITGGTLGELMAERGPLLPSEALSVMRSVLTGLAAAHAAGLVHRDLKPDNVLIGGDGAIKIADFGLVRAADTGDGTSTEILGTAPYVSPEQVLGEHLDKSSDVYSAGILLYELLTGEVPFRGQSPIATAYQRLEEDVPEPSALAPEVPPLVDALVAAATQRRPEARFPTAGDFLDALEDVVAELGLPTWQVPVPAAGAAHRAAAEPDGDETTRLNDPGEPGPGPAAEGGETLSFWGSTRPPGETAPEPEPPAPAEETRLAPPAERAAPPRRRAPLPKKVSNRSPARVALWLVACAALLAAAALGGWWLTSGRYPEIPSITGMSPQEAVAAIENAGFEAETEQRYHDEVAYNHAIGTEPTAPAKVPRGGTVTVLVSQARPTVPEVPADRDTESYERVLAERTLRLSSGEAVYSDDVEEGRIVSVEPSPGEEVPTGSEVTVSTSKGPRPVDVPSLEGATIEQAEEQLEAVGLKLGAVTEDFDADVPDGEVASSSPAAGTSIARGSAVDVVVSRSIEVPDVSGLRVDEAREALSAEGISASVERDDSLTGSAADEVQETDPAPGARLDPDRPEVTLVVPGRVEIPWLVGKRLDDAREEAESRGLKLDAPSSRGGIVISQRPLFDDSIEAGGTISVSTIG